MKYFRNYLHRGCLSAFVLAVMSWAPSAYAQTGDASDEPQKPAETAAAATIAPAPAMTEIKGVKIGMTADDAVQKLGKPESSDAAGMYFELSNGQAMQLALDDKKHVITLSIIYSGKNADAPEFAEVFGSGVEPDKNENGSLFKRIRYSDLGIWVAYSRIGDKDDPMTTVTIQKIRH